MLTQAEQHLENIILHLTYTEPVQDDINAVRIALKKLQFLEEPERQFVAKSMQLGDC